MNSPVRLEASPTTTTPQVFTARNFEAFFSLVRHLGCVVCLAPQLFLLVYVHMNVRLPGPPAAALMCVLSALAASLCLSYQSE